jgi:hypothetical protein
MVKNHQFNQVKSQAHPSRQKNQSEKRGGLKGNKQLKLIHSPAAESGERQPTLRPKP